MNHLKQIIYATILGVVEEQSPSIAEIHDQDALVDDLGLKSLDLARMIAMLELKLELDPFAELVSITSIRTVGDLCYAYARCAEGQPVNAESTPTTVPAFEQTDPRARQRELRQNTLRGV